MEMTAKAGDMLNDEGMDGPIGNVPPIPLFT